MRAFAQLWDELTVERYGVTDPKQRRFRYGVQVNSLGLTEAQPENNVQRIVLEMLGVTLSQGRPGPRGAAAGVERGARAAAAVGPAVVAAAPAGAGLRVRPAGVRRPVHRVGGRRGEGGRAGRGCAGRDRPGGRPGWRGGGGRVRLHEVRAGRLARRRVGGRIESGERGRRRRQPVRRPPSRTRSRPTWTPRSRPSTPTSRRPRRRPCGAGGPSATRTRPGAYERSGPRAAARRRPATGANLVPATLECARAGRDDGGVGRGAARGVRRVPRADRGLGDGGVRARRRPTSRRCASEVRADRRRARRPAAGAGRQARASTGTATAPSRSRSGPATRGSRWSTRGSG